MDGQISHVLSPGESVTVRASLYPIPCINRSSITEPPGAGVVPAAMLSPEKTLTSPKLSLPAPPNPAPPTRALGDTGRVPQTKGVGVGRRAGAGQGQPLGYRQKPQEGRQALGREGTQEPWRHQLLESISHWVWLGQSWAGAAFVKGNPEPKSVQPRTPPNY